MFWPKTIFFPIQKNIKDKIDEYNSTPEKNFVNETYFLYDKGNLILGTFITALNKKNQYMARSAIFKVKKRKDRLHY